MQPVAVQFTAFVHQLHPETQAVEQAPTVFDKKKPVPHYVHELAIVDETPEPAQYVHPVGAVPHVAYE